MLQYNDQFSKHDNSLSLSIRSSCEIYFRLIQFAFIQICLQNLPKPYKVWSFDREIKKSILANNLDDLKAKAAKKLGYNLSQLSEFRLVLEADGTEIEDDQYFQTAAQNAIFILLKDQERWLPQGVEELKAG